MKAFKVFLFGLLYGWFLKLAIDRIYGGNPKTVASGPKRRSRVGQSMSALPRFSDIDLLGYGERVIDLDSEIADRALDLRVAQ